MRESVASVTPQPATGRREGVRACASCTTVQTRKEIDGAKDSHSKARRQVNLKLLSQAAKKFAQRPGLGGMGPRFRMWGASVRPLHWSYLQKEERRGCMSGRSLQGHQQSKVGDAIRWRGDCSLATLPLLSPNLTSSPMHYAACSERSVDLNLWLLINVSFPSLIRRGDKVVMSRAEGI